MELCLYEMYLIYLIFDNGLFKAKLKCGVGGGASMQIQNLVLYLFRLLSCCADLSAFPFDSL